MKALPSLWTVWLLSDIQSVPPTEDAVRNPALVWGGSEAKERKRGGERGAGSEGGEGQAGRQTESL